MLHQRFISHISQTGTTKLRQEPECSTGFVCLCSSKLSETNQRPTRFCSTPAKIKCKTKIYKMYKHQSDKSNGAESHQSNQNPSRNKLQKDVGPKNHKSAVRQRERGRYLSTVAQTLKQICNFC